MVDLSKIADPRTCVCDTQGPRVCPFPAHRDRCPYTRKKGNHALRCHYVPDHPGPSHFNPHWTAEYVEVGKL